MDAQQSVIKEYGNRITQLEKDKEYLLNRLIEVEHNLCTCSNRPSLIREGSEAAPFELEYEDSNYVTPPVTLAAPSPPSKNTTLILVQAPR
jgi:hypothetical protein